MEDDGDQGHVHAIHIKGSNVYFGGRFDEMCGTTAHNIAMWNGETVSVLGTTGNEGVTDGGGVYAISSHLDIIYVGGNFTQAGSSVSVLNYAEYSSEAGWVSNFRFNDTVYVFCYNPIDEDRYKLYIGGDFTNVNGGVSAKHIVCYDGNALSSLAKGLNNSVYAIEADGNKIYVGGYFTKTYNGKTTLNRIAVWNSNSWSPLGNGLNDSVNTIQIYYGVLYVGGDFEKDGSETVDLNNIAVWNNNDGWSSLGNAPNYGLDGEISRMIIFDEKLYAVGYFNETGYDGMFLNKVARFNIGEDYNWQLPFPTFPNGTVMAITKDNDNNIYVGGDFSRIGDLLVNNIAKWNINSGYWEALVVGENVGVSGGDNIRVSSLCYINDGQAYDGLYVGGYFAQAGGVQVNNVARWDGSSFTSLTQNLGEGEIRTGVDDVVNALEYDTNGNLYIGGEFAIVNGYGGASNLTVNKIAIFNLPNNIWYQLADGESVGVSGGNVKSIAYKPSYGMFIGGNFSDAGSLYCRNIVCWKFDEGNYWEYLYSTFGVGVDDTVNVIEYNPADNCIYVGGIFHKAGIIVNHIAKWNGDDWFPIGNGVGDNIGVSSSVNAIAFFENTVILGGSFSGAQNVSVGYAVRWDGKRWIPFFNGSQYGFNDPIHAICIDNYDNIYFGGEFSRVFNIPTSNLCRLDLKNPILENVSYNGQSIDYEFQFYNESVQLLLVEDDRTIVSTTNPL